MACNNKHHIYKAQLIGKFDIKDLKVFIRFSIWRYYNKERIGRSTWSKSSTWRRSYSTLIYRIQNQWVYPFLSNMKLFVKQSSSIKAKKANITRVPYSSTISSLIFTMMCMRPDIIYTMGIVSQYIMNSSHDYWIMMKWILGI